MFLIVFRYQNYVLALLWKDTLTFSCYSVVRRLCKSNNKFRRRMTGNGDDDDDDGDDGKNDDEESNGIDLWEF